MAKTAPPKNRNATSVRSRASRRAASPGIDLDKSIKEIKAPADDRAKRPSVLAIHQGAGVSKRSKNCRKSVLSTKAKRRQERGLDRAEAVMDKKVTKIEKSKGRARNVQERAKNWEDLNKKMLEKKALDEALAMEQENWEDQEEDEVVMEDIAATTEIALSIPLPTDDGDEIL